MELRKLVRQDSSFTRLLEGTRSAFKIKENLAAKPYTKALADLMIPFHYITRYFILLFCLNSDGDML